MPSHSQKAAVYGPEAANGIGISAGIERLARRQRNLIRGEQLVSAGLSERGVRNRVARRRLFRVHRGVFAIHPPPFATFQLYLAAVYACGSGSLVSDLCAVHLLGLSEDGPSLPAISNAGGRGRSRPGITVHQRSIDPRDRTIRHGIPCTSPARTIIDCAYVLGADGTEDLIMAADSMRILNRRRLEELADEHCSRPGVRHVLALITDDPVEARSANERRMRSICWKFGVPQPMVNHPIRVGDRLFVADFHWPDLNLVVEADSWRWHGGRRAGEEDADRGQILATAGLRVVRFTRDQIKNQRERTGLRLVALTSR